MNTEGGTNNKQFSMIYKLLKDGCVKLNKDECLECRLNFSNNYRIALVIDNKESLI